MMDENEIGYVIVCQVEGSTKLKYFGIDYNSGGVSYWSSSISGVKLFNTVKEALEVLKSSDFTSNSTYLGGKVSSPRMLYSGAGLCNTRLRSKLTISIRTLITSYPVHVTGYDCRVNLISNKD